MSRNVLVTTLFLVGFGAAGSAHADVPFFNATCPGQIEIHADEGGPIYFNGVEAKLHRFNSNYYEASQGPMTVSVSVNPDGSVTVSYTRHRSGNGMCQINAHQRHGRRAVDVDPVPELEIGLGDMPRFCAGEASAAFDRRPNEITTNMAYKIGRRYVVQGWFDGKRGSTFFNCYFDGQGNFIEVH